MPILNLFCDGSALDVIFKPDEPLANFIDDCVRADCQYCDCQTAGVGENSVDSSLRVLVLGGYGLIGREIVEELTKGGCSVTALGRSARAAQTGLPSTNWIISNLARLNQPALWRPHLAGIDAIVNASGALQSGGADNLEATQQDAIKALIVACEQNGVRTFVQISAPGALAGAGTEFLRTKGLADQALRESGLNWVILKPGVVIAANAYGGSSLVRMIAGCPLVLPLLLPKARLQTVDVRDVTSAVAKCLREGKLARSEFDLVAPEVHTLEEVVLHFRRWLGFPAPIRIIRFPCWSGYAVARLADVAGQLGWRPPMRTTAIRVLENGVTGDSTRWTLATGMVLRSLPETLARLPSTRQERVYSRSQLLFPLLVVSLSLFWIASGAVGLWQHSAAAQVIASQIGAPLASLAVSGGGLLDIAIGLGLIVRRTFRAACLASIGVASLYTLAGTILRPDLWADPLGPFVKIIPAIMLAAALAAMWEDR